MTQDYQYQGLLTLATPMHHGGDEVLGTTRPFRTLKRACSDGKVRRIPFYAGNALRGVLRDHAAKELMEALGEPLPPNVYDFFTSGGALAKGSDTGTGIDVGFLKALVAAVPMVAVFGGSARGTIMAGKLKIDQMLPVCRETASVLPAFCREHPTAALSYRDLLDTDFGTRKDDKKQALASGDPHLAGEGDWTTALIGGEEVRTDLPATQMKYEQEVLIGGAALRWGFSLKSATLREWNVLRLALARFAEARHVGAKGAVGYGEIASLTLYPSKVDVTWKGNALAADTGRNALEAVEAIDLSASMDARVTEARQQYHEEIAEGREEILSLLRRL